MEQTGLSGCVTAGLLGLLAEAQGPSQLSVGEMGGEHSETRRELRELGP